jgi:hypothetical protein
MLQDGSIHGKGAWPVAVRAVHVDTVKIVLLKIRFPMIW